MITTTTTTTVSNSPISFHLISFLVEVISSSSSVSTLSTVWVSVSFSILSSFSSSFLRPLPLPIERSVCVSSSKRNRRESPLLYLFPLYCCT